MTPALAIPRAVRGAPAIDESYQALVVGLPPAMRAAAEGLPHRLGLARAAGGGWGEFVGLCPNRALPLFAAEESPADDTAAARSVHRFVTAHHAGAIYWLLRDRLRDDQVAADGTLIELSRIFGAWWRLSLYVATGDDTLVDVLMGEATVRWESGTLAERRALAGSGLPAARYAALVRDKLAWISVPSRALLATSCGPGALRRSPDGFLAAHELFLLALQAIDDVIDRGEDRALRGCDVPAALGCSPGGLLRAAPKLAARAAAVATAAGFTWWGCWLRAFARAIGGWRLPGDAVADELEGIAVAGELDEAVMGGGRATAASAVVALPAPAQVTAAWPAAVVARPTAVPPARAAWRAPLSP